MRSVHALGAALLLLLTGPALASPTPGAKPGAHGVDALPDIFGPGAVLRAGDVRMKVTNFGFVGNVFPNLSSDPSGQWPDSSGVTYLNGIALAVGAVDFAGSADHPRRASFFTNWRPATLDAVDRIYSSYDGMTNGARFVNDDNDHDSPTLEPRVDEDFLDGRDNDGDGLIDEDFGALGDEMFSCVLRDDTPEATAADTSLVPLGLECRQLAWCYSHPGFSDFNVVEYTIRNVSGHTLDSLYVGWSVDMDVGPVSDAQYFFDDQDLPGFPSGEFVLGLPGSDPRRQHPHSPAVPDVPADSALCPRLPIRVNAFAVRDGDGDGGLTPGVGTFLLVDHTVDPTGASAPQRVGFRAFRSFTGGTPFPYGGNPITPEQRYQFMSGTEEIDPATGFIDVSQGAGLGDYVEWCSIGPFRQVPDGGTVRATIAFAVQGGSRVTTAQYASDYQAYRSGTLGARELFARYPVLRTAFEAEVAHAGSYVPNSGFHATDFHGRETRVTVPPGSPPIFLADCDGGIRVVTDRAPQWFDFDCDYCTGVWNVVTSGGLFHHTWWIPAPLTLDTPARPSPRLASVSAAPSPASGPVRFDVAFQGTAGTGLPRDLRVAVYDLGGRLVRRIEPGVQAGPDRALTWDLADASGRRVPSGLYFCRAVTGGETRTLRVIVAE
jgi:hypothetical protein